MAWAALPQPRCFITSQFPRPSTGDLPCMQSCMEQLQAPHKKAALEGQANAAVKKPQIISGFLLENDGMVLIMWQMHY